MSNFFVSRHSKLRWQLYFGTTIKPNFVLFDRFPQCSIKKHSNYHFELVFHQFYLCSDSKSAEWRWQRSWCHFTPHIVMINNISPGKGGKSPVIKFEKLGEVLLQRKYKWDPSAPLLLSFGVRWELAHDNAYVVGLYSLYLVSRSKTWRSNLNGDRSTPLLLYSGVGRGVWSRVCPRGLQSAFSFTQQEEKRQPKGSDSSTPPLLYFGAGRGVWLRVCPRVLQSAVSFSQHEGKSNLRGHIYLPRPSCISGWEGVYDYGYVLGSYNLLLVSRSMRGKAS